MTTQRSTVANEPWAKPASVPTETREETARIARRARKNMAHLNEIFDDLLEQHRGRLVIVYGDCQVLIGDDGYEMKQFLTEDERKGYVFLPISTWWIRYGAE